MSSVPAGQSMDDLLAAFMDGVEIDESRVITSADINRQTASRFAEGFQASVERMLLRMTGATTATHHIAVRTASRALLALQESLSSIGASISDRATRAGKLPIEIRRATELHLTPRVAPGSVEFTLVRPDKETLFNEEDDELFDGSLSALLTLFADLGRDDLEDAVVVEQLRAFGPRTAKHLFDLSQVLLQEDVGIDLDWQDGEGRHNSASLGRRSAAYLKELARVNSTSEHEEILVGTLVTVSQVDRQALMRDDGSRIDLEADPALQASLKRWYGQRVQATVSVRVRVNLTTGNETRTYTLLSVEPGGTAAPGERGIEGTGSEEPNAAGER